MQANQPRRRYPRATAAWIFVVVIITLAVIVVRGPARFFQAPAVQSDASCTVRHCADTIEAPDGRSLPRDPDRDR
jgi:hypothetical protein